MPDQADALRLLVRNARKPARVLAVTSGKGGVGKTNLSVNLAIAMAARGARVIVLDLDLGLANVDLLCDLRPRHTVAHVVSGQREIQEAVTDGPGGIRVLAGAAGIDRLANLDDREREGLLRALEQLQLDADVLILDTGAGIGRNTIAFAACADEVLVVTTPEPTATLDAYAAIKCVAREAPEAALRLVVNQVRNRMEAERVAASVTGVAQRFLNIYVETAGCILSDPCVPSAVRQKRPFVLAYPASPAADGVRRLAGRLLAPAADAARPEGAGFFRKLAALLARKTA
jgi:flagellar biosynthesis protein FlhG